MWGQKKEIRLISRRDGLKILSALGIIAVTPKVLVASPTDVSSLIDEITKGKHAEGSDIYLDLPEIAENGNQVKVSFEIESPMTPDSYVKKVYIFADGNPAPRVAEFTFTPRMGICSATTRMRLAKTQDVHLLAEFSDGVYATTKATVKVTIGGCGG
ncbi:MAG: thiosulfate oxidation carrier protein SoxY [Rhodobacteraceae bacterium]|nr:MAG: thiosulfate oxidation carrier protein SoxY [Paracoccaceae bacterium]